MRTRFVAGLLAVGLVAGLGAAPASAAKKQPKGPLVVGEDPSGDWGSNVDATLSPIGDALGQDLVAAEIGMDGTDTVNFVIKVNSLPPIGGMPEITRYVWDFNVDGEFRELDGKFTNYTRGVCDPTSGQCPPPRDPGMQPFILRGNCTTQSVGINLTVCEEFAIIKAIFDAGAGTITVPVPMEVLGAKPGSKIEPAANIFGGSISASPAVFLTSGNFPMDTMAVTKTFVIPAGKKGKNKKK
jgi:hypothetical protein